VTTPEVLPRFYAALHAADVPALLATLHPDFRGRVTAGLPFGIGGDADGPVAMLRDVWGRAATHYELHPEPEQYLPTDDGRVLVLGWYLGRARATGRELRARFAHLVRVADGQVVELEQITDSARWCSAAGAVPA
jgi:2-(1,2-epoxy-1,2-dihydrophenyl)acetyl-CoA isomerase